MITPKVPTTAEVREYFTSLSNWGRWGPDDELGTLNFITPEKRVAAAATISVGESIGCARPILRDDTMADVRMAPLHFMMRSGESDAPGASDFLGVSPHGFTISHIDALAHRFYGGAMYNGYSRGLVTTAEGATVCSIETMKDGVVTRGLLFDVPRHRGVPYLDGGDPIFPEELEEIEEAQGIRATKGDAVLIRTGWPLRRAERGPDPRNPRFRPGLHAACLPWLYERQVAVCAADASQDVAPSGYDDIQLPIHDVGIPLMGLCLLDACQFDDLAAACERYRRWEFFFALAPLRFRNATGSPATPLAVF
jgi:kynurenine formamidase